MVKRIVIIDKKPSDWTFNCNDKWTRYLRSVFEIKTGHRTWFIKPSARGFMKTKRDQHEFWFYTNGINQFIESEELISSILQTK